jgi:hypothetical protein
MEHDKEVRIFYQKLSNELRDLARLRLPLNLLYRRHTVQITQLKQNAAPTPE